MKGNASSSRRDLTPFEKGLFSALMNSHKTYTEGGWFMYVKGDSCKCMFPVEIQNQTEIREGISHALASPAAETFFFILEEREGRCDMHTIPKQVVFHSLKESLLPSEARVQEVQENSS